jgi:hypothetical protein
VDDAPDFNSSQRFHSLRVRKCIAAMKEKMTAKYGPAGRRAQRSSALKVDGSSYNGPPKV